MEVSNAWGKTIYLYTNGIGWPNDNAKIWVHAWGSGQDTDKQMTKVKDQLYIADISDADTKVIFTRTESTSTGVFNQEWNRVGEQILNDETPCLKLTTFTTGTWGKISYDAHIYLDNSVANWTEAKKEFMIGHSFYSDTYTMTQILNTKLYYLAFSDIWHGYWDYGFIGVTSHWGPYNNQDITTRIKSAAKRTGTRGDQVLNGTKLFVPENANNDATLNKFDYNSYNDLNHTQTIKAQVKYGETDPAYKQVISPATITATTKYFNSENSANGNGSLTIDRGETNPAELTQTVNAAYTSTVTLSYTNLHDAYEFMDWWDDTNQKTISTSATCTYVATKATTIYARFKAKEDYTRTVYLDARNWNADNPRYAVYAFYGEYEGQNEWIDMTPAYGTNWYYTCEVPAKYSHVIFCRMNPDISTNSFDDNNRWGQTNDLLVVLDLDKNNCFTPSGDPTEQGGKTYNGNWSTPPTFTVTLAGTDYGTYTVTCGEQKITISDHQTQTITNVAAGTQLTITDIIPNDGYDQTMVYSAAGANYTYFSDSTEIDGKRTYTYTVNSDVSIAEDFRTKEAHTIYIKVTSIPYETWCKDSNGEHKSPRIIYINGLTQQKLRDSENLVDFEHVSSNSSYSIYRCTIPKGNHSFKLFPCNSFDPNVYEGEVFDYKIIPDDPSRNCFEFENKENNKTPSGEWVASKVYLDPCKYGTYGIRCNGQEYYNYADNQRIVELPFGAVLEPIDAISTSPHYGPNPRYASSIVINEYFEVDLNKSLTLIDQIRYSANLVTTQPHRVILHIPNNILSDWNADVPYNCVYAKDYRSYGSCKFDEASQTYIGKLIEGTKLGSEEYYYFDIPAGFNNFVFERKTSLGEGVGPHRATNDFLYQIPLDENLVYTLTGTDSSGKFIGTWGPLPEYTITLGYPDIGRFGIIVDGETIYASNQNKRDTYITVPYGTEVQLLKGEPGDAAYTNNLVKEINSQKEYIIFGESENQRTFTITSNVKFDDIFATKPSQTVFIAVPKNHANLDKWYNCSDANHKDGHDVYAWQTKYPYDYLQNGQAKQTMQKKVAKIETDDYTYYQYTLDGHVYELDFQFKSAKDANGTWDSQAAHAGTKTSKCPPISTKNCFYLDGGIEGTNHVNGYTGYWDYGPPCQVKMGYTNIGRYGIKDHTGEIHYATPGGTNTTFYVPYGSKVEVLEGEPGNNAYNGMVGLFNGDNVVKKFHDGQNTDNIVTITGYTVFDDLFVSKKEHIVYLGVPNEGFDNWRLNDGERMTVRHLWPRDYIPSVYVNYEEMFVIDDITYYKFTLPQGLCSFQFSHRQQSNDSQISASRHFLYQIPVTEYNCFILENRQDGNGDYDGYWAKLPAKPENEYDYRVLYAEKELIKTHEEGETEDWETAFRTVYEHPSDIITKPDVLPQNGQEDIVSLHINTSQKRGDKTVHPMVILQQFKKIENNTYKWVNLQAHTVLPLKATGNMGMLPGRKKTFGDLPFYDDGIEAIKNDTTYSSRRDGLDKYKGSGVWNFTVTQSGSTVTLNVGNTTRYTGKYYIRTEALTNGWNNYKENLMTYSDYADYNSGFSHYFCKWLLVGNNVKFTIANDYAQSISDPLYGDATDLWGNDIDFQMVERDQVLNEDANVRFAWYEMNNFVHRAYLSGSTHVQDRFLVVKGEAGEIFSHPQGTALTAGENGTPRFGLDENEEIFRDDANWIYHADIQIKPGCIANVTAQHFGKTQTFIKNRTLVYGENLDDMKYQYPIRLLYDFKINRLITGYIPNGDNNTEIEAFTTDLMLIRREEPDDNDSKVTQLVFNTKAMDNSNTRAYGVLELSKERLVNDGNYNDLKRRLYWISFPFDVRIADVFGSGIYAQHWIIQSYNGQKRADNGYYYETTESNWEYHFDPNTINAGDPEYQGVLKKGVGYVVALNLYNIWKDQLLDNTKDAICLYFPSKDLISADIVKDQDITIDVPEHECKKKGREIADSHWNVIGVPAYKNAGVNFDQPIDLSTKCAYYYRWDKAHNAYTPMASYTGEFSTLHAYMVQYHGGLNWTGVVREGTQSLAARSNTDHQIEHNLRLELQKDGKELDRTFVRLQENEDDVTSGFDFNYDLSKIINAGTNIYTIVKTNDLTTNVSGNVLPLAEDMVIPVGVVIDQAGEYTFSMPDGTDGIIAELIDYQTNTRTNLLLDNYTVTLPAGTNNSRFALSLQPDKTVTSVDNIGNEATGDKVKKYLIDGKLYLQKDGVLYDAQGHAL